MSASYTEISDAYLRTPEGTKFLRAYSDWKDANPDAMEGEDLIAKLKQGAKADGKGIGEFAIAAIANAGEEGIPPAKLLRETNVLAPKKFGQDSLNGWLRLQGEVGENKPNAPVERNDKGNFVLTAHGKGMMVKEKAKSVVEDASKALVVMGYNKKKADKFVEFILLDNPKLADSKDAAGAIAQAVQKKYGNLK